MKVLIVVDVQNGFCFGGELAVPKADEIVNVINRLMASGEYDHVVATKDWHPANHKSFAVNHEGKKPFDVVELNGRMQMLWPAHCVQGSFSAEIHHRLETGHIEKVIYKGTNPEVDSYSGFFDNDHRSETELRRYLEKLAHEAGIGLEDIELTICGLATDYCVAYTARDAKQLVNDVKVVVDACRPVNLKPDDELRALKELAEAGVELITSREILESRERERGRGRQLEMAR